MVKIYRPINETWTFTNESFQEMLHPNNKIYFLSKFGSVFPNIYHNLRFGNTCQSKKEKRIFYLEFFIFASRTIANISFNFKNVGIKFNLENVTSRSEAFFLPYERIAEAEEIFVGGICEVEISGLFEIEKDEYPNIPREYLNNEIWEKSEKDFDIIVISGNENTEKIVKIHKQLLLSQSPVFEAMFRSGREEFLTNTLKIVDFDFSTVNSVVEFFYGRENLESFSLEEIFEIVRFSDKYVVESLTEYFTTFLSYRLSPSNICEISNAAIASNSMIKLRQTCFKFLVAFFKQTIPVENFDTLNAEFAAELFQEQ
uniref:BTB domain-containing protein n=1 Tax=Panagrolaimus sp. ES5 TaxID=591445 RepID=A0AC34FIJ7_9BILA